MKFNKVAKLTIAVAATGIFMPAAAQRTATVSGHYEYCLGNDDNVTIREAKQKAIDQAKSEAIAAEFGTLVASDFVNVESGTNSEFNRFYMMDTSTSAKGEWLGDIEPPKVKITVDDNGNLWFYAEVKGTAREITGAKTELIWDIKKEINHKEYNTLMNEERVYEKVLSDSFESGERFFVDFKSPSDGYLAIYLITGDDEVSCLLPYCNDTDGRFKVKGGEKYSLFDNYIDRTAMSYKLSTIRPLEVNDLVVIYSPHPFSKCNDVSKDDGKPNVLKSKDFARWLLKARRSDSELVVDRRTVQIKGLND